MPLPKPPRDPLLYPADHSGRRVKPVPPPLDPPVPASVPLYKSRERSQMPPDAVKMIDGGWPVWYRRGTADLMHALIELPPHPLERMQSNERFTAAVQETAVYSDTTLSVVAAQLQRQRRRGEIKHRPRLRQLHALCRAAAPGAARCDAELAAVFTR